MPKVVAIHAVGDVAVWLQHSGERAEAITGALGGRNVVDHVARDGSNMVAITLETDDVDALAEAVANPSPELAEQMQTHTVVPPLTIYVEA